MTNGTAARFDGQASKIEKFSTPFHYQSLNVSVVMRTLALQGTLFWVSGSHDYLVIGMKNGFVMASFDVGGGRATVQAPEYVSDGLWHAISFSLRLSVGILTVDTTITRQTTAPGTYISLDGSIGPVLGAILPLSRDAGLGAFAGNMAVAQINGEDLLVGAVRGSLDYAAM